MGYSSMETYQDKSGEKEKENDDSMNKELREWIEHEQMHMPYLSTSQKTQDQTGRKPEGLCSVCGDNKASSICLKCGDSVCSSCYFKIIRVCKRCVPKDIAERWDGTHPDWEKVLGVEWVD
jgi:hypothetical protein